MAGKVTVSVEDLREALRYARDIVSAVEKILSTMDPTTMIDVPPGFVTCGCPKIPPKGPCGGIRRKMAAG